MTLSRASRCPAARFLLFGLLAGCLLAPVAAQAAPGAESLSPRLVQLASPALRSLGPAQQAERLSLAPHGPASLQRLGHRVVVNVRFEGGALAGVDDLRAAGAEVLDASGRYQTVTVAAKAEDLPALGAVPGVGGVTEVLAPVTRGADCGGLVRSEGDAQLNAATARASWGSTAAASPSASSPTPSTATPAPPPTPPRTSSAATCRGPAVPAAPASRSVSSTTPKPPARTRAGRWPRSSTTSPPARRSTSPAPSAAKSASPTTSAPSPAPAPR